MQGSFDRHEHDAEVVHAEGTSTQATGQGSSSTKHPGRPPVLGHDAMYMAGALHPPASSRGVHAGATPGAS